MEYSKEKKEETNIETIFKDELKFENIGKYNDLDIDLKVFEDFNSKFEHIDEIENCYKEYNEKELVEYLKNVLETDNPVYKKYKDEKLTSNQFDLAYKNILEKNEKCQKKETKTNTPFINTFCRRYGKNRK